MNRAKGRGFTILEIMVVVAIISILSVVAIPNLVRGRVNTNEASAIGNLRALANSLEMYRSQNRAYPTVAQGWQAAMFPSSGAPPYAPLMFNLPLEAAPQTVQGYRYRYADGVIAGEQYQLTADPAILHQTGTRAFYVDETGIIRHCVGSTGATVASRPVDQGPNVGCL